jgi:ABC-type spermidine/putrescine transport system permease subunit II
MFTYVQYSNDPTIAAISTLLVAGLLVFVLIGEWRFQISRYIAQLD